MLKRMIAKKIIAVIMVCCTLICVRPANAFVWPTLDMAQISSFVTSITNGITTITNAKSQLDNITKTIKSVGDQIATIKKYVADLKGTIAQIKESIQSLVDTIKNAVEEIKSAVEEVVNSVKDILDIEKENAKNTVSDVNNGVENGATEDDIQKIIEAAMAESEENKNKVNALYDETLEKINTTLDDASKAVDLLVQGISEQEGVSAEDKEKLQEKAEEVKEDIENLKQEAEAIIKELKDQYNTEYSEKIASAYEEYSKAVSDYYDGKISLEDLKAAGEALVESVNSVNVDVNQEALSGLSDKVNDIISSIEELKEEVLDVVSNDKEYSDEDEEEAPIKEDNGLSAPKSIPVKPVPTKLAPKVLNKQKLTYIYKDSKDISLAKSFYSKNAQGKPFLIPNELFCGKGEFDENDLEKLSEDNGKFRNCVIKAKVKVEEGEDASAKYKPYYEGNTSAEETKIAKDGVYSHILQDYSAANIVTISKAKQFAASWLGTGEGGGQSEYDSLQKMISKGDVDNSLNGVVAMSTIDLWSPRLWSYIRRVDSVARAKEVVGLFAPESTLYLDAENDDVVKALRSAPGVIDGKKIFPHVMLHHCGIKADDVSIDYESSQKDATSQEKAIMKCMYEYAYGVSLGGEKCKNGECNTEIEKEKWKEMQKKALNDAAFENLTLAVITNYNSTKDYVKKETSEDGKVNIVMLQNGIKEVAQSRDGYAAGAQINYYSTQQLLNIIDSDALDLQMEILKDLQKFDFSYFPDEATDEGV